MRALVAAVVLSACAATQVQKNTTDMGDTIVSIQRDQILRNIGAAISDRSSVPSGIVFGTGQANVSLGLTPAMKTTALNMSKPSIELDISPTDTWTSQWQFTSIINRMIFGV
jgi:hypothetical protein